MKFLGGRALQASWELSEQGMKFGCAITLVHAGRSSTFEAGQTWDNGPYNLSSEKRSRECRKASREEIQNPLMMHQQDDGALPLCNTLFTSLTAVVVARTIR